MFVYVASSDDAGFRFQLLFADIKIESILEGEKK